MIVEVTEVHNYSHDRDKMKIFVIGAGVTGITTAYFLAKQGYEVSVIDKESYPSTQTSKANGGQLSVSNAEVWNNIRTVKKGIKWMFDSTAPLSINWSPSISKFTWMFNFLRNIPNYEKNTVQTIKLALDSRNAYEEILKEEDIKYDRINKGILHIYSDPLEFNSARTANKLYKDNGLDRREVTVEEIRSIEKTIDTDKLLGGFYTSSDYTGDIFKFTTQLAKVLEKKYNVKFYYNHEYKSHDETFIYTDQQKFSYNAVVICKGANSGLGVYPIKGYSITVQLDTQSQKYSPTVSLLDDGAKIVTARLGKDRLRVAGTAEINGWNKDIRNDRIQPLIKWVNENFPNINTTEYIPWTGLRPMTPSMMPIVMQDKKNRKTFYNTGHGHLGWTLAAGTARTITNTITMAHNSLS
jgi:D-amino-acid dehydrogenase